MTYNAVIDVLRSDFGSEVITLAEVKRNLGIDFTDFDTLLTELITDVREQTETFCGVAIVDQTVTVNLMNGLGNSYLPYGPIIGDVTSVVDTDGTAITDAEIKGEAFKRLVTAYDTDVTLVYSAGYGESVPEGLKRAMIQEICYQFEHRGDGNGIPELSGQFKAKAKLYKRNKWVM